MKKRIKIVYCSIIFLILIVGSIVFYKINRDKNEYKDLINISSLSEEFMDNYFEKVKELKKQGSKENTLIITSKKEPKNTYGATTIIKAPNNQYFLQYKNETDKSKALEEFKNTKEIIYVEGNVKRKLLDTDYNSWGISKMGLDTAISISNEKELPEVVVAVIDSGCDIPLVKKYYPNKIKGVYNLFNDSNNEKDIDDALGHGTHVLGTIAEGTPSNVKVYPIKVSEDGDMDTIDIISAIDYVTYYELADVMNMSFGGYYNGYSERVAIEAAMEKNIITVAAAGNDDTYSKSYPAAYSSTISIASVDENLNKSDFSNYGSTIDFAAPGTKIKSIMGNNAEISKGIDGDNDHETISGTSMAAPHAASAVAILKSYNKNLTLDNVKELLKRKSIDLGTKGKDKYYGNGFITFYNAKFCSTTSVKCDEFNVFEDEENFDDTGLSVVKIEPKQKINYIAYNFGNITNLMNIKLKIYYSDTIFIEKSLSDLDDVNIENYDSNIIENYDTQEGIQNVNITYRNKTITIKVGNMYALNSTVWEYENLNDTNIKITGPKIGSIQTIPNTIYVPNTIDGKTVTMIGESLFKDRTELKKVVLPDSITKIGDSAFKNCRYLYNVNIPSGVTYIGQNSFKNTIIENISLSEALTYIGEKAFENTKIVDVNIPKKVTFIGTYAFAGCNNLESIIVDENNVKYSSNNNNVIIEKETNKIIKANYNSTIPTSVTTIGEGAYYNDSRITSITIPSNIETISYNAFAYDEGDNIDSSLSEIYIPSSVKTIEGSHVFGVYRNELFDRQNHYLTIYTVTDTYAKTYAINKKVPYQETIYKSINTYLTKEEYNSFQKVSGYIKIYGFYKGGEYDEESYFYDITKTQIIYEGDVENLPENIEISYIDDREYFVYGDKYFNIKGKDLYGNDFNIRSYILSISKIKPTYSVPKNLKGIKGKTLESIELPDNFEWMNPNQIMTSSGDLIYKAKYIPTDTSNYEIVENINVTVNVSVVKSTIIPNIVIEDKTYDGTTNLDKAAVKVLNLNSNDYIITNCILNNSNVGNTSASITLKLTNDKYEDYELDGKVQEKTYIVNTKIIPKKVLKPTLVNKTYTYNENIQEVELNNFDSDLMNITGNKMTNAGEQDVEISLKSTNYIWDDDTNNNIILKFIINKALIDIQDNTQNETIKYDNKFHTITLNLNKNVNVKYMDNNQEYTLDNPPTYKDIGIYTIKYKVYLNNNYTEYYNEKIITIYNEKYNITFYSNDRTNKSVNQEVNNLESVPLRKNTFTREDYIFKEWSSNPDGTGDIYTDEQVININSNLDLYAQWKKELPYEIHNYNFDKTKKYIKNISINTTIEEYKENIELQEGYTIDVEYKIIDNKKVLYTGCKTKIYFDKELYGEITNIVLGDTNKDGKLSYIDYVNVYNHIQKTKNPLLNKNLLENDSALAADYSLDNNINYLDYVKIYNKIKELKGR